MGLLTQPGTAAQIKSEQDLRTAVESGGQLTFDADAYIVLTTNIVISNSVTLDAKGHLVTIDGDDYTRIFSIMPGVTNVNFIGIALIKGASTNGGAMYIGRDAVVSASGCCFRSNKATALDGANGIRGEDDLKGKNGADGKSATSKARTMLLYGPRLLMLSPTS